jgi:hypothetical protein
MHCTAHSTPRRDTACTDVLHHRPAGWPYSAITAPLQGRHISSPLRVTMSTLALSHAGAAPLTRIDCPIHEFMHAFMHAFNRSIIHSCTDSLTRTRVDHPCTYPPPPPTGLQLVVRFDVHAVDERDNAARDCRQDGRVGTACTWLQLPQPRFVLEPRP